MNPHRLYIDIETLPWELDRRRGVDAAREIVKVPANYTKRDTIERYIVDHAEDEWRAGALGAQRGQICVLAWAFDDGPVTARRQVPTDDLTRITEAEVFAAFAEEYRDAVNPQGTPPMWIGHNLVAFDLPFLAARMMMWGVRLEHPVPYQCRPWDTDRIYDTMIQAPTTDRDKKGLAALCEQYDIRVANDLPGSGVLDAWLAGEYGAVLNHCIADVEATRQLHMILDRRAWA